MSKKQKQLGEALDDIMGGARSSAAPIRKEAERERLRRLPKTTVTVSFRVPKNERSRLERVFSKAGLTMAEGFRRAVYAYVKDLQEPTR